RPVSATVHETLYLGTLRRNARTLIPSGNCSRRFGPRMLTLGVNYSQMHDSSACIVRDGEVLFAVAEERLSRTKHDARFPVLAIRACLDFTGIRSDEIDFVCQGWSPARTGFLH